MVHVSAELLAGHALGQLDQLDADQLEHVADCPQCRAELSQLSRLVELSQQEPDPALSQMPLDAVWRGIRDELSLSESGAGQQTVGSSPAPLAEPVLPTHEVSSDSPSPPVRRRSRVLVVLAAAIGVIVGIGATAVANLIQTDDAQVLSSTPLVALPGHSGEGTAELVRERETTELRVRVEGAPPQQEFREVWLINVDGERMVSIGLLASGDEGEFAVPMELIDEGYRIVDISIEPDDGDPTHSGVSIARGELA